MPEENDAGSAQAERLTKRVTLTHREWECGVARQCQCDRHDDGREMSSKIYHGFRATGPTAATRSCSGLAVQGSNGSGNGCSVTGALWPQAGSVLSVKRILGHSRPSRRPARGGPRGSRALRAARAQRAGETERCALCCECVNDPHEDQRERPGLHIMIQSRSNRLTFFHFLCIIMCTHWVGPTESWGQVNNIRDY